MNAIQIFQKDNNLTPDGIIGAKTIDAIMTKFKLSKVEVDNWLGQGQVESGNWSKMREDLDYRAERLIVVFKKYFPTLELAKKYEHNPEKLANYVYDDARRDANHKLGNTQVGDGWKFRASGCGITGRANFQRFADYMNDQQIMIDTDLVWSKYFLESFYWYFKDKKIFKLCTGYSSKEIELVTMKVNGGLNGLKERIEFTNKFKNIK